MDRSPIIADKRFAHQIKRRDFLKLQTGAALWLALGAPAWFKARPASAAVADVAVALGAPGPATRAAVAQLGGMAAFVKPGAKVVIKPNMSFANATEEASNTHPEVVRELVALCKEAGAARVRVLDHPLRRAELCIEGAKAACEVFNEDIVRGVTQSSLFKPAAIPSAVTLRETDVMQEALEADVLIAAPVAKSHGSTGVSLSMKGMMGLIWNRGVMHSSHDLSTAIVDLASLLRPRLVVVDGTRVLSTNGPGGPGTVLPMKTIIASTDMVAADAMAVEQFEWYGQKLKARQVKHILLAHQRGLGRMDIENLAVKRVTV